MPEEKEENQMLEVLRLAYPGRRDEQVLAFALIYAGILWGRDYRFGAVPRDEHGRILNVCDQKEEYHFYLSWLADYLYGLEAEPDEEQAGLCIWVDRMWSEDAMILLGMNAALYETTVIIPMEHYLEKDLSFEQYYREEILENQPDSPEDLLDRDEAGKQFDRAKEEYRQHQSLCPDVAHADTAYRLPLSVVLKKVASRDERKKLLEIFYWNFYDYFHK